AQSRDPASSSAARSTTRWGDHALDRCRCLSYISSHMVTDPRPFDVFRAIADPTRRAILDRLRAGPSPVNALAADFRQSRPAISKHLRVLKQARLVHSTQVG